MFKTKYNFKDVYYSNPGTKVVVVDKKTGEKIVVCGRRYTYKQDYDKQGKRHLVINDSEDVYQKIQSFKDDTDIYKIVARYFNGDVSALDKNKGFYADVSEIPHDIREWKNKIEEGKNVFAGLPTDLKREFGNDINQFMTSIFNKDFEGRYNDYISRVNGNVNNNSTNTVNSANIDNNVSKVGEV